MSRHRRFPSLIVALAALAGLGPTTASCVPAAAVGTAGAVGAASATVTQERGFTGVMSDTRIRLEINHYWFQASEEIFTKINLQVQEGRVLLTGNVADPQTRVDAVRLTWQADGIKEVINEIKVDDSTSVTDWARDIKISQQLKNKLLFDKDVASLNYSIEVVNQRIYLIGVAQDQAELDRVIAHAKDIAYARGLVNYVRLKDDPARAS
jgi:osmotically-inducible protein OsmY